MALERFVDDKCRRCYACIRSCPQIDRGLKEFALTFRRGEKVTHAIFVTAFLTLFMSGVILNHFREDLSQIIVTALGLIHRIAVPVLILSVFGYFLLDRHHLMRRLRQITTWGREDIEWLKQDWRALWSKGRIDFPTYGEAHPGRKFWQLYLCLALPVFAATGTGLWIGEATLGTGLFTLLRWTHIVTAFGADVMVALHVLRVLIRPVWQRLRRMAAVFGKESELLVERAQFLT
jgi:cytochrome b subunit of formate dehydrogenase